MENLENQAFDLVGQYAHAKVQCVVVTATGPTGCQLFCRDADHAAMARLLYAAADAAAEAAAARRLQPPTLK